MNPINEQQPDDRKISRRALIATAASVGLGLGAGSTAAYLYTAGEKRPAFDELNVRQEDVGFQSFIYHESNSNEEKFLTGLTINLDPLIGNFGGEVKLSATMVARNKDASGKLVPSVIGAVSYGPSELVHMLATQNASNLGKSNNLSQTQILIPFVPNTFTPAEEASVAEKTARYMSYPEDVKADQIEVFVHVSSGQETIGRDQNGNLTINENIVNKGSRYGIVVTDYLPRK
jgi:hypothetical protein